jgi:hypothetical protein
MPLTVGDVQQRAKELRHLAESDAPLAGREWPGGRIRDPFPPELESVA